VLVLAVATISVWWSVGSSPAVRYATAPVTIGPIARSISATGTVNPELTIIVGTYVSGVIQELSCDYNTQVKRGQSCAKIDPRPYQSIVDQGKANLAVAKAQLQKDNESLIYAKLSLGRLATLVQTNAVSRTPTTMQGVCTIKLWRKSLLTKPPSSNARQCSTRRRLISTIPGLYVPSPLVLLARRRDTPDWNLLLE
jgi:multidrug efflux pump subunit AcrA (membrane-fusion protein)